MIELKIEPQPLMQCYDLWNSRIVGCSLDDGVWERKGKQELLIDLTPSVHLPCSCMWLKLALSKRCNKIPTPHVKSFPFLSSTFHSHHDAHAHGRLNQVSIRYGVTSSTALSESTPAVVSYFLSIYLPTLNAHSPALSYNSMA